VNFVFLFCLQINLVGAVLQDPITIETFFGGVRLRSAYFVWPGGNQQGTLQQALQVSFGCIWPKTVGSSSHLGGAKSGAAGGLHGATEGPSKGSNCHILAKNDEKIGPNPAEKNGVCWVDAVMFLAVDRT
jgi:hypothetical protein